MQRSGKVGKIPRQAQIVLVFAVGAALVTGLAALVRAGITAGLESQGRRLDRWRRVWFHPERELAVFFESLLIIAFVDQFVRGYGLAAWVTPALVLVWALHLPGELRTWTAGRTHPDATLHLHRRGFWLLRRGPLWLRALLLLAAAALYFLSPAREALGAITSFSSGTGR